MHRSAAQPSSHESGEGARLNKSADDNGGQQLDFARELPPFSRQKPSPLYQLRKSDDELRGQVLDQRCQICASLRNQAFNLREPLCAPSATTRDERLQAAERSVAT